MGLPDPFTVEDMVAMGLARVTVSLDGEEQFGVVTASISGGWIDALVLNDHGEPQLDPAASHPEVWRERRFGAVTLSLVG